MQGYHRLLSSRPGAPQRALETANGGKRTQVRYPHVASHLQISAPGTLGSHRIGKGHGNVSAQCPYRRGRQAPFRSLNQYAEVVVPSPSHMTINYTPPASNDPQGNPTQQPITSTTEIGPQSGLDTQATGSPVVSSVMTGAVALMTPQLSRCRTSRLSTSVSTLDDIWEVSTSWCCGIFCGVDLCDDGELDGCGHSNGVVSGNGQGAISPRRVVSDGMPVMLY
jgi:hypothetical protein